MTNDIILYSNNCFKCIILEKKLKLKKLNYTKVSDNETIMRVAKEKEFYSLPFIQINGEFYDFSDALTKIQ